MKTDLHPDNYRLVVFEDLNNGHQFLTRSTAPAEQTTKWSDGQTYPLIKVHISSASHPFYTGQEKLIDIEGRVDKFKARQKAAAAARQQAVERQAGKSSPKSSAKKPAETKDTVAKPKARAAPKPAAKT